MDTISRCPWANNPIFHQYHDEEWGRPVHDDRKQFEFLTLEAAQAGLSWSTILKRRAEYQKAFANWDAAAVAQFTADDAAQLLLNPGIIRNRLKIAAAINNAQRFLEVQEECGSFDHYIWGFVDHHPIINTWTTMAQIPTTSVEAMALSRDLKKRGFRFVGPTIIYAHMQAVGMVNDHLVDCFCYQPAQEAL
jgi:DNA-3-methyladenine glycosylase I